MQIDEEQHLIQELKKIEMRKKEREKKTQDLQKLITAADSNMESRRAERKPTKKKFILQQQRNKDGTIKVIYQSSFYVVLHRNIIVQCRSCCETVRTIIRPSIRSLACIIFLVMHLLLIGLALYDTKNC